MSEIFQLGPTTSFTEPQRRELNALFLRLTQAISGGINVTTNIVGGGGGVGPGTVGTVPAFNTATTLLDSTAAPGDVLLGSANQTVGNGPKVTVQAGNTSDGGGQGGNVIIQPGTGGDSNGRVFINDASGANQIVIDGTGVTNPGNLIVSGSLTAASFVATTTLSGLGGLAITGVTTLDAGAISTDGAGSLTAAHLHAGDGFTGTVSPVTSITVVDGIVTAAS